VAVQEAPQLVGRPRHREHDDGDDDGREDSHGRSTRVPGRLFQPFAA
jgi:hypothetical protein